MKRRLLALISLAMSISVPLWGQRPMRPRLLGISQIVVRAHDLNASRHFYGDLLGFEEAFTVLKNQTAVVRTGLPADQVSELFFKVNNRQYIVVMPESSTAEPRFVRYAVETDDAEAMRVFLKSLGYSVPSAVHKTPIYDLGFDVVDPDGTPIQIVQFTPESLTVQNVGKFLAQKRLSNRILHTGFSIAKPETVKFYQDGFSVREFWRADPSMTAPAAPGSAARTPSRATPVRPLLASLSNLKLAESDDYIEWSFVRRTADAPAQATRAGSHIALETQDMAKTIATLEALPAFRDYDRKHEAHVGINHKWQGNFFDPDGTRTEFMEPGTADGLPSPMSHAPYF
jgi:catechol 2,3-dioxygenase-like lactoylglutathione lyase family enzyme